MTYYIFGARSIAIGTERALQKLNMLKNLSGFLVSSLEGNPSVIDGYPVFELSALSSQMSAEQKAASIVYIAASENAHPEIARLLAEAGFVHQRPVTSSLEAELMERYYQSLGLFPSVHSLPGRGAAARLCVFSARFCRDKALRSEPDFPEYVHSLLLGCDANPEASEKIQADFYDNTGDNISNKNPNYCEMTAHYWIWKHLAEIPEDYVGVFHYRRKLELSDEDLQRIRANNVDAVLPFPMLHLPDAREHHTRYVKERDWETMLRALEEVHPEWMDRYDAVFSQPYFYNYNLLVAKKSVFSEYCQWLFPILFRTEDLSVPRESVRADRYLAYMSESLTTLYFMSRAEDLNIAHTGRILYT